ncbi:hypothetical protein PLEOSDRAFT_169837 [Pleurotus ostreatus PC15]|uniref:Uncharacterized protein n=1 Tax=Pleurotus ostreatus (strain PC15) TaxID=1137138 RepID=A0A067NGB1_PLEO1|nr:hypothetical protein PLEOSDRAFT_169837 [Pleurotus ostreatus PC15]
MIIAEKLTLPNQGETILDLTMSDDDGVAVEIADNSPIVIDSDPASIRGSSISSPTMDNRQQTLNKTNQRPAQNSSLVNPFMEWLNMDKMSPFAVEADRAWSKRKAVTRRTHRPRKATARELDSAANYTFFFTNL